MLASALFKLVSIALEPIIPTNIYPLRILASMPFSAATTGFINEKKGKLLSNEEYFDCNTFKLDSYLSCFLTGL